MKHFFCGLILLGIFTRVFGQGVTKPVTVTTPQQIGQFFNCYSIINPASIGSQGKFEVELGTQRHRGAKIPISTPFATIGTRLGNNSSKNFQVMGITLIADKDGPYLKASRGYLNYGWHTKLNKQVSLSAGTALGIYSFYASAPGLSGGYNVFDATVGLWLYTKEYYMGFSINQIPNRRTAAISEVTELRRHYNLTGGFKHEINPMFSINPKVLVRYIPDYKPDLDVALIGILDEVVSFGCNYRHNKGVITMLGIERLNIGSGELKAMFSYSLPFGTEAAPQIKIYELGINYRSKSNEKKK